MNFAWDSIEGSSDDEMSRALKAVDALAPKKQFCRKVKRIDRDGHLSSSTGGDRGSGNESSSWSSSTMPSDTGDEGPTPGPPAVLRPPPPAPVPRPDAPPDLVAPPPPPPLDPAARVGRGEPGRRWGPFREREFNPKGVHKGWGVICKAHTNAWAPGQVCKRTLMGVDRSNRQQLLAWLLAGVDIPGTDINGKDQHFAIDPRAMPIRTDDDLEDERRRRCGF